MGFKIFIFKNVRFGGKNRNTEKRITALLTDNAIGKDKLKVNG